MGEIKILFHVHVKWNFIDKILFDFIIMHKPIMASTQGWISGVYDEDNTLKTEAIETF